MFDCFSAFFDLFFDVDHNDSLKIKGGRENYRKIDFAIVLAVKKRVAYYTNVTLNRNSWKPFVRAITVTHNSKIGQFGSFKQATAVHPLNMVPFGQKRTWLQIFSTLEIALATKYRESNPKIGFLVLHQRKQLHQQQLQLEWCRGKW